MTAEEIYEALVESEYQRLRARWFTWNTGPPGPDGEERMRHAARYSVDRA